MVNPRYGGLDRYNRPYVATAAIGRQVPDRNDVMALERPKAVMTVHGGASVVLTAATGIYQSQAQLLDLFADVNLIHENGTRFVTQRAHLNLSDNSAECKYCNHSTLVSWPFSTAFQVQTCVSHSFSTIVP